MKAKILLLILFLSAQFLKAQNTNLGTGAGNAGSDNTSLGYYAGNVVTSSANTFVGYHSGKVTTSGSWNSFLGSQSGISNTTGGSNVFIGRSSGLLNTTGSNNFLGGAYSGASNTSGSNNIFVGRNAGYYSTTGNYNIAIGNYSMSSSTGSGNVIVGYNSGTNSTVSSSSNNVMIGYEVGRNPNVGSGNIFVGYQAGNSEGGSDKLYIENSKSSTPLIYGDFATDRVGINSLPGSFTLNVGGPINATGLYVNGSPVSLGVTAVSPWTIDGTAVNYNNGNVGIGILSNVPAYKLDVNGTINATGFLLNGASLSTSQWTTSGSIIHYNGGNVGIGTDTPGSYKLNVWGSLRAHEIVVNTTGADFVFEDGYKLRPLEEVEKFINEHKHLPEIPSAQEMQIEGMKMGDTQTKLLQKIEELTLYLIELRKELQNVKEENKKLESKINK